MGKAQTLRRVVIDKLVPYEKNSKKHSESQIEKLADSIKEFGFISPVLIDKDFNIIAGHGRIEGAKRAGLKEVPCVTVEGLTDEQRRAYIIADNRLSEFGEWDKDLIQQELSELGEIELGFDIESFEFPEIEEDLTTYYGDERERTMNAYNLHISNDTEKTNDFWQMPIIKNDFIIPSKLIGFNYAKTSKDKKAGIHFFIDDYQFERIWSYPEKYTEILKEYECILTPDFSLYLSMPMPMKIWNVYRSRQIGAFYQSKGLKVIPTVSWAEPETYSFCFEGIEKGGIVAISTLGIKNNKNALSIYKDGTREMIERLEPEKIIVYGGDIEADYCGIETISFNNEVLERWK